MSTATTQVQFFEADYIALLQKQVNEFLQTKSDSDDIIDIKYNHYRDPDVGDHNIWYTAMVIYRHSVPTEIKSAGIIKVFTSR